MTLNDSFPLGQPGFVSHPIDRAAHLRGNDEKLSAMETHRDARAYVIHRDSLLMTQGADGPRALLTLDEARKFGANPGTIFLGLKDGAAIFGMGISATAAEELMEPQRRRRGKPACGRCKRCGGAPRIVHYCHGKIPCRLASTSRLLRQLRHTHLHDPRRLEAGLPKLQGGTFSAHGSCRHHAGDLG